MPPKQKYRTDAKRILYSVPDCNIIVSTHAILHDRFVSVEPKSVIEYNISVRRVPRLPGAMTACSGVAVPMHALRETCTRMGLRYQIARGVMGGVHVDLIMQLCKACTSRVQRACGSRQIQFYWEG